MNWDQLGNLNILDNGHVIGKPQLLFDKIEDSEIEGQLNKLKESKKNVDILMHKGDFGIEPCAYVLGKDAVDVVKKVIKIKEELKCRK